jgi:ATP-dependent Clp protease, protease subunit
MKVKVISGPPASGKSTYVIENKGSNDLIFDFDSLMSALSGRNLYDKNNVLIPYLMDFRDLVINRLADEHALDTAWIIISQPTDEVKDQLESMGAEFIAMDADKETCLQRIEADEQRINKAEQIEAVEKWFSTDVENMKGVKNKMSKATAAVLTHLKNKNRKVDSFMNIVNKDDSTAEMYLYGDIVSSEWDKWESTDTAPEDVRNFLSQLEGVKNINVYINSGGGSVFAGLNIYNMLKRHEAQVTVHVDGMAASIASIIAMAADKLIIPDNAFLMIHKPMIGVFGNAFDFKKAIKDLDAIESGLMNIYAENLAEGADIKDVQKMLDAETWLNGKEAAKYFNIEVGQTNEMVAQTSLFYDSYNSMPESIKIADSQNKQAEAVAKAEAEEKEKYEYKLKLLSLEVTNL